MKCATLLVFILIAACQTSQCRCNPSSPSSFLLARSNRPSSSLSTALLLSGGSRTEKDDESPQQRKPSRAFIGMRRGPSWDAHTNAVTSRFDKLRGKMAGTTHPITSDTNSAPSNERAHPHNQNIPTGVVTGLSILPSWLSWYGLTLVGTALGFQTFLYFITVGYAAGVGLPVAVALTSRTKDAVWAAQLHALLLLAWSIRTAAFLLWREHVNWPALHAKMRQLHVLRAPDLSIQVFCWLFYSLVYSALAAPCWLSMHDTCAGQPRHTLSWLGVALQATGLVTESIADWQKSRFKAQSAHHRSQWCHEGLWQYSSHPNYAGEFIFWLGSLLVGVDALRLETRWEIKVLSFLAMAGGFGYLSATLQRNVAQLDKRLRAKYGRDDAECKDEFDLFMANYGVFGPRWIQPTAQALKQGFQTKLSQVSSLFEWPANLTEIHSNRYSRMLSLVKQGNATEMIRSRCLQLASFIQPNNSTTEMIRSRYSQFTSLARNPIAGWINTSTNSTNSSSTGDPPEDPPSTEEDPGIAQQQTGDVTVDSIHL